MVTRQGACDSRTVLLHCAFTGSSAEVPQRTKVRTSTGLARIRLATGQGKLAAQQPLCCGQPGATHFTGDMGVQDRGTVASNGKALTCDRLQPGTTQTTNDTVKFVFKSNSTLSRTIPPSPGRSTTFAEHWDRTELHRNIRPPVLFSDKPKAMACAVWMKPALIELSVASGRQRRKPQPAEPQPQ